MAMKPRSQPANRIMMYADQSLMQALRSYARGVDLSCNRVLVQAVSEFLTARRGA